MSVPNVPPIPVSSCVIVACVDTAKLGVVNELVVVKLVAFNVLVAHVKPVLVVVIPSPLPIIICPAVLIIFGCVAANAPCNPDILLIANSGICDVRDPC